MAEIGIKTERRTQLVDVTARVARLVKDAGIRSGICHLYVSHTTAGVMINEHDDPDVARDIEMAFDRLARGMPATAMQKATPTRISRRHWPAPPPRFLSRMASSIWDAGREFSSANSMGRARGACKSRLFPTNEMPPV